MSTGLRGRLGHAALVALVGARARAALATPGAFSARYAVHHGGMRVGDLAMSLTPNGAGWLFETRVKPNAVFALMSSAKVRERSELELTGGVLRPLAYRYSDGEAKREVSSFFDWTNERLVSQRGGKPLQVALPTGAFDRLSVFLAAGQALREGHGEFAIPVAEKGKVRTRTYRHEGEETVDLGSHEIAALRVREVREPDKTYTVVWYAPALEFLPVRIESYRKGRLVGRVELISLDFADQSKP